MERVPGVEVLLHEHAIRQVLYRYCRGIDRRDFALVRSCYHADATDDHGNFQGGVDAFLDYAQAQLSRFDHTMHVIANVLIEQEGDRARSEAYTLAHHHVPADSRKPERHFVVGLRYVDRFEHRGGRWAIAERTCVFEWARVDPVGHAFTFPPTYQMGEAFPADPVFRPLGPARRAAGARADGAPAGGGATEGGSGP